MAKDKKENIEEVKDLDWDSPVSADASDGASGDIPEPGEYGFMVIDFEKTVSKSGKKMAKINLELDETGRHWKIYDYLVLTTNMEWKIATFFESLGLKKKGEPLTKMPWDKVLGAEGRVKIKHEIYEGEARCKVDRYLISAAAEAPSAPEMPFEI